MQTEQNEILERGLVVESSFRARLELMSDLRASGVAREIIEAKSISDGLRSLQTMPHDACFLGSALKEAVAVDFLKRGSQVSLKRDCAFIAVVPPDSPSVEALRAAGAHGMLVKPYSPSSFTELVQRSVKVAVEQTARTQGIAPRTTPAAEIIVGLPEALSDLAAGLCEVADDITRGKLSLQRDGTASLATRDAIRVVVERVLTNSTSPTGTNSLPTESTLTVGSFDYFFVNSVVQWFTERVHLDQRKATESLRRRLVTYARTPQLPLS